MVSSCVTRKLFFTSSVFSLSLATITFAVCAPPKLPATFSYKPADGSMYEIKEKRNLLLTSDQGEKKSHSEERTDRIQVKAVENGFDVTVFPITKLSLLDGRPPAEGTDQYFLDYIDRHLKYTLKVDSKGTANDVSGQNELADYAANDLRLDSAGQEVFKGLATEYLKALKSGWNTDLSLFLGRSTKKGTTWVVSDSSSRNDGFDVPIRARFTVADPVTIDGKAFVKVNFTCTADPSALRDYVASLHPRIWLDDGSTLSVMSASIPFAKMNGGGELIVDPNTSLIYKSSDSIKVSSQVKASSTLEVDITMAVTEDRKCSYIK